MLLTRQVFSHRLPVAAFHGPFRSPLFLAVLDHFGSELKNLFLFPKMNPSVPKALMRTGDSAKTFIPNNKLTKKKQKNTTTHQTCPFAKIPSSLLHHQKDYFFLPFPPYSALMVPVSLYVLLGVPNWPSFHCEGKYSLFSVSILILLYPHFLGVFGKHSAPQFP